MKSEEKNSQKMKASLQGIVLLFPQRELKLHKPFNSFVSTHTTLNSQKLVMSLTLRTDSCHGWRGWHSQLPLDTSILLLFPHPTSLFFSLVASPSPLKDENFFIWHLESFPTHTHTHTCHRFLLFSTFVLAEEHNLQKKVRETTSLLKA